MSPDAQLRMEVYQEGQRAFNAGTPCPYHDWRAGTWGKGYAAAKKYAEQDRYDPTATVPCGICEQPTRMLGTKRCDRCWELERRMRADPDLVQKILAQDQQ